MTWLLAIGEIIRSYHVNIRSLLSRLEWNFTFHSHSTKKCRRNNDENYQTRY